MIYSAVLKIVEEVTGAGHLVMTMNTADLQGPLLLIKEAVTTPRHVIMVVEATPLPHHLGAHRLHQHHLMVVDQEGRELGLHHHTPHMAVPSEATTDASCSVSVVLIMQGNF